jgi:NAD-dependent DNA ligase
MTSAEKELKAHQYLYYCKGEPVLSDWEYDEWCKANSLNGKGGSDLESSYTDEIKELAMTLAKTLK